MPTPMAPYRVGFEHGGGDHFGLSVLALFLNVVFWGALIIGIVLLVRFLLYRDRVPMGRRGPRPMGPRSAALDELELRYARGDIQRDDYLQRRLDLTIASGWGGGPPPGGPYGPGPGGGPYGPPGRGGPYGMPPGSAYGAPPYGSPAYGPGPAGPAQTVPPTPSAQPPPEPAPPAAS